MDINALITHQFDKITTSPWSAMPDNQSKFVKLCVRVKKLAEAHDGQTIRNRVGAVVRSILTMRDLCLEDNADSNLAESLIRNYFLSQGIMIDTLAESSRPPVPVPAGVYVIRGREVNVNEDLLPIDECLGHSVYRANEVGYFILSEAKKKGVEEDAPVNAVGHGNIAGVSPGQEPPGPKGGFKARMMLKRKKKSPQVDRMDGWPK